MSAASTYSFARQLAGGVIRGPKRLSASVAEHMKRRHCVIGSGSVLLPSSRIENFLCNRESIVIGANARIAGELLVFAHGGRIQVGDDCFIGEGTRVWSANSVKIGHRVLISHAVNIHDTNSHSTSAASRHAHMSAIRSIGHPAHLADVTDSPVVIEDDVWIGFNAVVLKGVRIGRGSIIGAAALISKDVLPYSQMVGNPARCVGSSRP